MAFFVTCVHSHVCYLIVVRFVPSGFESDTVMQGTAAEDEWAFPITLLPAPVNERLFMLWFVVFRRCSLYYAVLMAYVDTLLVTSRGISDPIYWSAAVESNFVINLTQFGVYLQLLHLRSFIGFFSFRFWGSVLRFLNVHFFWCFELVKITKIKENERFLNFQDILTKSYFLGYPPPLIRYLRILDIPAPPLVRSDYIFLNRYFLISDNFVGLFSLLTLNQWSKIEILIFRVTSLLPWIQMPSRPTADETKCRLFDNTEKLS